eukprot:UN22636
MLSPDIAPPERQVRKFRPSESTQSRSVESGLALQNLSMAKMTIIITDADDAELVKHDTNMTENSPWYSLDSYHENEGEAETPPLEDCIVIVKGTLPMISDSEVVTGTLPLISMDEINDKYR